MRLKTPDARVVHMKINTKNSTLSCDKIVQARAIYWPLFVLDEAMYLSKAVLLTDLDSANYLCNLIKLFLCSLENVSRLIFFLPKISRLTYQIKKK